MLAKAEHALPGWGEHIYWPVHNQVKIYRFCESEGLSSFAQRGPLADQTAQVWYYTNHVRVKSIWRNSLRPVIIALSAKWAIKNYYSFVIINVSNKLEPSLNWVILSHNKDLIPVQKKQLIRVRNLESCLMVHLFKIGFSLNFFTSNKAIVLLSWVPQCCWGSAEND